MVRLRLSVTAREDLTVIAVDGRLVGEGALQLEQACRDARRPLVLDLAHLAAADDTGVVTLRRLAREGAHLLGASPYMALLLDETVAAPKPPASTGRRVSRPIRRRPTRGEDR